MTKKVIENVILPIPGKDADPAFSVLIIELVRLFASYGFRLNEMLPRDGSEGLTSYLVAAVPTPSAANTGGLIYVSDETGGSTIAFSDGTNWRRVQDRAIVA